MGEIHSELLDDLRYKQNVDLEISIFKCADLLGKLHSGCQNVSHLISNKVSCVILKTT